MKRKFNFINTIFASYPKKQLFSVILFLLVFLGVKVISFVTPVLLSNLAVTQSDYGYFEYLLSTGVVLSILINTGFNGAYPYFLLKLKLKNYKPNFYFHVLWGGTFTLACTGLYLLNITSEKIWLSMQIGCIISTQGLLSSMFKSQQNIISAVLFDTGLYLLLMFYVLYLVIFHEKFSIYSLKLILGSYFIILSVIIFFLFLRNKIEFEWVKYIEILKYAYPLVISSFLIIFLTGSTRIYIEYFLTLKDVGEFSFYFRIAAIVIMIHQAINIIFFSKMYQISAKKIDFFFTSFLSSISIVSFLVFLIIPKIGMPYLKILQTTYTHAFNLFIILSFQMLFWISNALNENIVYRENLSKKMNRLFIIIIIIMLLSMYILCRFHLLSLSMLVFINTIAIYLSTEAQFFILSKKDVFLTKNKILNRVFAVSLCVIYFLRY